MTSSPARRKPGVSLLTLLLLVTIGALAVGVWRAGESVVPLRGELLRLRRELGSLTIADPAEIHAQAIPMVALNSWRWRIYLPPGRQYSLRAAVSGDAARASDSAAGLLRWGPGVVVQELTRDYDLAPGEYTLDATIAALGEQMFFRIGSPGDVGPGAEIQSDEPWVREPLEWRQESDVMLASQKAFPADKPLLLLQLEPKLPAADARDAADSAATPRRLLIWIAPISPSPPMGIAAPPAIAAPSDGQGDAE